MAMSDDIWRSTATRIATAIRGRDISAREALESCLGRMAAVNAKLNAVTVDQSTSALEAADRADAAVAKGDELGALHGVPVTIKENVDQQGSATTNGVVAFQNIVAREDSPIVANWRRAGAISLGRTNTPAFSFRLDTVNDLRGRTYSPWSKTHTPGGSSGGAGSSVAAGITPLAHGNDIAGSVRFPAYCCGLAGIRPSFGRVPASNPTQTAERSLSSQLMSVQGPLARSVADVRLGLVAMAARDPRDPWWTPAPLDGPAPLSRQPIRVGPRRRYRAGPLCPPSRSASRSSAKRAILPAPSCSRRLPARSSKLRRRSPTPGTRLSTTERRVLRGPRSSGSRCRCRSFVISRCR